MEGRGGGTVPPPCCNIWVMLIAEQIEAILIKLELSVNRIAVSTFRIVDAILKAVPLN